MLLVRKRVTEGCLRDHEQLREVSDVAVGQQIAYLIMSKQLKINRQPQYLNMRLPILFAIITLSQAALFDTTQVNKHGDQFKSAPCNANTFLDFSFSPSSTLNLATNNVSSVSASTLRYLDMFGNQVTYTLDSAQLASQEFLTGLTKSFVFKFTSGVATVLVAVPIIDGLNSTSVNSTVIPDESQQTVVLSKVTDTAFYGLKSIDSSSVTSMPLSYFNVLNDITNGKFYSIMDTTKITTLLIAKIHYQFTRSFTAPNATLFNSSNYTFSPTTTGDVLCWGSQENYGFFQTHMRESVPLWTFLISVLLFWLFILLSNEVTPEVYERSFKDNKWTCWSLYSLFYLCHQEWFTRTSRTSLLLINFVWQGMVASAIYYHQGVPSQPSILVWVGVVAFAASVPIPYLVGNIFFRRIYSIEEEKFKTLKEMHQETNKEKHEELERAAILMEEHIYGIYYFYYSMIIILFAVFAILTVHLMQQFPRDYYYLHFYWLASVGIAFALDHIIFDPLMTLIFGNQSFYRSRGYYYEGALGELAREAE